MSATVFQRVFRCRSNDVPEFCLIERSVFVDLNSARETAGSTSGRGRRERERERLGRIKDVEQRTEWVVAWRPIRMN